jgi:hypothetical protein
LGGRGDATDCCHRIALGVRRWLSEAAGLLRVRLPWRNRIMSGLEAEAGHVRAGLAAVNGRLHWLDARVDRMERRLDLAEAVQ